jgi:hypothetical protein
LSAAGVINDWFYEYAIVSAELIPLNALAEDLVYSITIIGNVERCRTEAEVSNSEGTVIAIVYDASDGWHTDTFVEQLNLAATEFQTAIDNAKENLSHYVNRRGENPPKNATWGAFSLWLMVKDDGTAMGMNVGIGPKH